MRSGFDKLCALVPDVAHCGADPEPFECLWRLALLQEQLLGALLRRRRVKPLGGQLRRQHNRPPVVHVVGISCDDHETIVLAWFSVAGRKLPNRCSQLPHRGEPLCDALMVAMPRVGVGHGDLRRTSGPEIIL